MLPIIGSKVKTGKWKLESRDYSKLQIRNSQPLPTALLLVASCVTAAGLPGVTPATAEKIEIRKSGHVVGDLVAAVVAIEEGAYFKGSIEVARDKAREAPRAAAAVRSA